jgi:DNA-binding NtrC family response regulator/predicted hydrocarbon binding protein
MNNLSPARGEGNDPRECVYCYFHNEAGQIWLHEQRMLLVHAEAMASLRKELVDTLGMERARGVFMRMGYASGVANAELARTRQNSRDVEAYMAGLRLQAQEGIGRASTVRLELDRITRRFYGEFVLENSWEGQWQCHNHGAHPAPVCWMQVGYACGYASTFMGQSILFKETECTGMGQNACRIVGKPVEEWDDATEFDLFNDREPIVQQISRLQASAVELDSVNDDTERPSTDMVGTSPGFRAAYNLLKPAAASSITVLLLGETGVGKELFARALHGMGTRQDRPFVAVNCAAIPRDLVESELFGVERGAFTGAHATRLGRFERANGGTLFLDEIGDLPLSTQGKLLRVLQEGELERLGDQKIRKIDVRVVAATQVNLQQLVKQGQFRPDLYYRLNAYQIEIPPLRERKEDISPLANNFLARYCTIHDKKLRGFTDKAKRALLTYGWPGNIRELQNMIERGVVLAPSGSRIEVNHLFALGNGPALQVNFNLNGGFGLNIGDCEKRLCEVVFNSVMTLEQIEAMLLDTAVTKAHGNLSSAARMLGVTRPQIAYRLKRLRDGAYRPSKTLTR